MATNVPPHNLREVIDGVIWAIETEQQRGTKLDKNEKLHGLMNFVKGPDFSDRAGTLSGDRALARRTAPAAAAILMRAKASIEQAKKGDRQSSSSPRFRIR